MTKKDYIKFAKMVRELPQTIDKEVLKKRLIEIFKEERVGFNEVTFRFACNGETPNKLAIEIGKQIPRR